LHCLLPLGMRGVDSEDGLWRSSFWSGMLFDGIGSSKGSRVYRFRSGVSSDLFRRSRWRIVVRKVNTTTKRVVSAHDVNGIKSCRNEWFILLRCRLCYLGQRVDVPRACNCCKEVWDIVECCRICRRGVVGLRFLVVRKNGVTGLISENSGVQVGLVGPLQLWWRPILIRFYGTDMHYKQFLHQTVSLFVLSSRRLGNIGLWPSVDLELIKSDWATSL
jgi:hypothetical protein